MCHASFVVLHFVRCVVLHEQIKGLQLFFTARQRTYGKTFSLVCLSTGRGPHVTITHDTLDLIVQTPPTWDLRTP